MLILSIIITESITCFNKKIIQRISNLVLQFIKHTFCTRNALHRYRYLMIRLKMHAILKWWEWSLLKESLIFWSKTLVKVRLPGSHSIMSEQLEIFPFTEQFSLDITGDRKYVDVELPVLDFSTVFRVFIWRCKQDPIFTYKQLTPRLEISKATIFSAYPNAF